MVTRRIWLMAMVGVASGVLASGSLGALSAVSAQATQSGIKAKGKETLSAAEAKWVALTPQQQQQLAQQWHMSAAQAEQKWQSMTPQQQQQEIAQAKGAAQNAKQKWQQLPSGGTGTTTAPPASGTAPTATPPITTAPAKQ